MKYNKPKVIAQNGKKGSFAAGCPADKMASQGGGSSSCKRCERTA